MAACGARLARTAGMMDRCVNPPDAHRSAASQCGERRPWLVDTDIVAHGTDSVEWWATIAAVSELHGVLARALVSGRLDGSASDGEQSPARRLGQDVPFMTGSREYGWPGSTALRRGCGGCGGRRCAGGHATE